MLVLGIETSCDETAAAVVDGEGGVRAEVVHSQVAVHAPYGGVVPELASRDHLRNARPVVEAALAQAGVRPRDVDGIAVTCQPGLSGALLVGVQLARGLAFAAERPVVGVDHLIGHLAAPWLRFPGAAAPTPELPLVALLVSGGHTALYRVEGLLPENIRELGATRDDAAGEAFDKVAKVLGLGYPGGPVIDRLAREGDPSAVELARPMPGSASLEFSFSGLKTAVARHVERHGPPGDDARLRNLCAAFQRRVVDVLVQKLLAAARREGVAVVALGGGVAANRELRTTLEARASERGLRTLLPPLRACTDNAAMIALAGAARLRAGHDDRATLTASPRSVLAPATRKGRGRR